MDTTGFVLAESPHSKARALRALRKEQQAREQAGGLPIDRVKTLPTPPVAPVFPEFISEPPTRSANPNEGFSGGSRGQEVKRKTSMVKKFRDRIAK